MLELKYRRLVSKTATLALVAGLFSFISIPIANAVPADGDMTITETNIATAVTVTDGVDSGAGALTGVIYSSGTVTVAVTNAGATVKALCVTGGTISGAVSAGATTNTTTTIITASAVGITGAVITPDAAGTNLVIKTNANTCGGTVRDQITYTVLSGGASNGIATISAGAVCSATNDAGTALSLPFISSAAGFNIVVPIGASLTMALDENDNAEFNGPISAATLNNDGLNDTLVMSINTKGRVLIDDPGALDETFIVTAMSLGSASIVVSAEGASTTPTDVTTNSVDITVVASCASDVYVASKSFAYVKGATAADAVVASSNVDVATSASAGDSLFINITGKNTYGTALSTGSYAVSATNGALVSIGQAEQTAPSKGTVSVVTGTPDGIDIVRIDPASQLVTSTTVVTITHNGTPVTTKSLTFFGEAASIEVLATSIGKTSTSGAGTSTGFFVYQYKDSGANVVPGAAVSLDATTQTATVPAFGAGQAPRASAGDVASDLPAAIETAIGSTASGVGVFHCGSTAATSTVTIKHTNAISAATITKAVALTCAGGIDTYTVSLDKASYAVGEVATITITAKDSKGNPVADSSTMGADGLVSVGGGGLTKASVTADAFTKGVRTYKAQMTTAGTFNTVVSISGTVTKSAEAKYSVTDGAVSNAEVLKSIVALIASINKQIAALQKLILKR
jgi:hypothetical protein